jgi:TonB family protein
MRDGALDYPRQDEDGGFNKTFVLVAVVHLVLLGGLLLAALYQPKQSNDSVVWMSPGSFAGDTGATQAPLMGDQDSPPASNEALNQPSHQETDLVSTPPATPPVPAPLPVVEESAPPIPDSTPAATPTPRLTSTPMLRPTPTVQPPPKPSPKPTPKPTPKPSPTHSATPKSRPEVASKEKEKEKPKINDSPKPKTSPVKSEEKEKANSSTGPSARQAETGHAKGKLPHDQTTPGRGFQARSGNGAGAGDGKDAGSGDSALAAYVGILTDRFQAAWNQPTSEMALGKTLEVTVKLKVEADGTVTEFVIVEGSGNTVVDDSVRDAGKKITKLPPPPNGQGFSAPVRFELGN